jgi:hypothetical protein
VRGRSGGAIAIWRRANAAERAALLTQRYPERDVPIADDCKPLVPWDAADDFIRLAVLFLKS